MENGHCGYPRGRFFMSCLYGLPSGFVICRKVAGLPGV